AVVSGGYDVGIAFDSDADRCIIVDEKGNIIDGDKIMGVCGLAMLREGRLAKNTIVSTVMSNLGFHDFARQHGISLVCTAVGDRNVLEKMIEGGYVLGGEQSGHIIFREYATTGDGQLAALQFLSVLAGTDQPVSALAEAIPYYPQVLINVRVEGGNEAKAKIMASDALQAAIAEEEKALADKGRVLVRASGTEPKIRVMVEAPTQEIADETAERLADLIKTL
ncbi:MAG: phosphoglucosamine mutase, partial [Oscillospiraceae bacterium]|nr:phosphoglucosamine mutase [Oscillospiraceae bacterium]